MINLYEEPVEIGRKWKRTLRRDEKMENLIKCPVCGIDFIHIKGCAQGLSKDGLSVDIYYYCENEHNFVKTFYSENGGHWEKTEVDK